jgi:spore germination cell wall hydrolase CwlJ-like protein
MIADASNMLAGLAYAQSMRPQGNALQHMAQPSGGENRLAPMAAPTDDERIILARTLQAEAGGEGYQGMLDVGSVIQNRARSGRYGDGVRGVIMKPGQFSAWNSVTGYAGGEQGQDMSFMPSEEALRAADAILSGRYDDQTGGATHYVNYNISQPSWFNDGFRRRGNHWFGNADAGRS